MDPESIPTLRSSSAGGPQSGEAGTRISRPATAVLALCRPRNVRGRRTDRRRGMPVERLVRDERVRRLRRPSMRRERGAEEVEAPRGGVLDAGCGMRVWGLFVRQPGIWEQRRRRKAADLGYGGRRHAILARRSDSTWDPRADKSPGHGETLAALSQDHAALSVVLHNEDAASRPAGGTRRALLVSFVADERLSKKRGNRERFQNERKRARAFFVRPLVSRAFVPALLWLPSRASLRTGDGSRWPDEVVADGYGLEMS
ncbi:hypothetical protein B2J93_6144 [Marssonina coronariae]|uniref:Uncharacterized protein n=1 Tax=Diplocarpon coronariae TaxID=2795749 RepID=A0A218ZJ50_9HELO|nr:hypothetical protein B2J93_6144 [Marssonina coronariae]